MNKAYLIIFDETAHKEKLDEFFEVVRSTYVSKQMRNSFIISAPGETRPKDIYDLIKSKFKTHFDFMVVRFDNYFGIFPPGVFEWIKETFPAVGYIE